MHDVVPAILPQSFAELEEGLARLRGITRFVQIDVADGVLVPNRTWPYKGGERFQAILSQEEGMPLSEEFEFELDLMVSRAKVAAEDWVSAGASRIIVHEKAGDAEEALQVLHRVRGDLVGLQVGIGVSRRTPLARVTELAPLFDFIQVMGMGIEREGFQGEKLDESVFAQLTALRGAFKDHIISVDGGVTLENGRRLLDAGANRLVVGSALLRADTIEETFMAFQNL